MLLLNILLLIIFAIFVLCKRYDDCLILGLIIIYYYFDKQQNENFSLESIQNATSLLNSDNLVVATLNVNNGANINNVQFNCPQLEVGSSSNVFPNSTQFASTLSSLVPNQTYTTPDYMNNVNNLMNNRPDPSFYALNIPNVSTLGGVTVGDNNNISMIAPNPSVINNFSATISLNENNVPMTQNINGKVSAALYNNPGSAAAQSAITSLVNGLPPATEIQTGTISTMCYIPQPVKS